MNRLLAAAFFSLLLGFSLQAQNCVDVVELPDAPKPKWTVGEKLLTVAHGALAFADAGYTQARLKDNFVEYDPLARPFIHTRGLSFAIAGTETAGLAWLGSRMKNSPRWHGVWWVPQTVGIVGHGIALGTTVRNFRGK